MLVQKNRHGHYETLGSINGYPVTFLIDTGASMTSVPGSLGRQLGVSSCEPRQFNTAGGEVTGCVTRVQELAFGTFLVQNVQVAVMPDMKGSALLGMNVLKMLKIEQQDSVLRLSTAKQH